MYIDKLTLKDFRNYKDFEISFDPSTNIIYGDNAQGKTNILESIYLSATTKSHKQSKDGDIIRFDMNESHIRTEIHKNDIPYRIDMHLRRNQTKVISINGMPIKKAAELLGILKIVLFSPEDLSMIKNGPSERRRFIDMELCQLDPYYLNNLSVYNKTLNQRNKLLKEIYNGSSFELMSMLDVYDEQLVDYGSRVIKRRREFIIELGEILKKLYSQISGGKEECRIIYEPKVEIEYYRNFFKANRNTDIRYKITSIGPHRDDISFLVNKIDVKKYGSQGQQRTVALSLKLSEIELIKKNSGDTPVLLLDDVLSELDRNRQDFLLDGIKDIQTIITCTGLDDFVDRHFSINRTFNIANGNLSDKG